MDVYWWLSACTEYVYCPACWIILPHPWGKLIKTQLFGKQHFKGFCENCVFLILPRICSQMFKDSQSRSINSSIFMVSPPRSQEKRWLTLPHFPLPTYPVTLALSMAVGRLGIRCPWAQCHSTAPAPWMAPSTILSGHRRRLSTPSAPLTVQFSYVVLSRTTH